jgi:hypothetical protein
MKIGPLPHTCLLFLCVCTLGCSNTGQRVIDCREAGLRAGQKYPDEKGYHTKDIHFNAKDQKCYLSVAGTESGPEGGSTSYDAIIDVDENREISQCTSSHVHGAGADEWSCYKGMEIVTRESFQTFLKLRMEQ